MSVLAVDSITDTQGSALLGRRNVIINGNFGINQRGVSGTVTLSAGAYGHDRWKAGASGCTYTFATSENITTLTITAGSLIQVVEGLNVVSGTHVLSWTGTAQGKIGAGSYGDSGITGSVTGGSNLNIEFGTGTVSKVQLEVGSVATPFEHRSYGEELALCQRYFWLLEAGSGERGSVGDGAAYVSSNFTCRVQCPQIMRDNPTMSVSTSSNDIIIYGNASADSTSLNNLSLSRAFPYAVVVQMNAGIAVTQGYAYWAELNNTANYKAIKFDAEL